MSVVIKSDKQLSATLNGAFKLFKDYKDRVEADGGFIKDSSALMGFLTYLDANNIGKDKIDFAASPMWGVKLAADGGVARMYGVTGNDAISQSGKFEYKTDENGVPYVNNVSSTNNAMKTGEVQHKGNLSLISIANLKKATNPLYSSFGNPLLELFDTTATGFENGLRAAIYHESNIGTPPALHFRCFGFSGYVPVTKEVRDIGVKSYSQKINDDTKVLNGYIDAELQGSDATLSMFEKNKMFNINVMSAHNRQSAGALGYYYAFLVANNLSDEQVKGVSDNLLKMSK